MSLQGSYLMAPEVEPARAFLDEAYASLDYKNGVLLNATVKPDTASTEASEWLEKGDWLALANRIGAQKVFFVNNDPVIVFHEYANVPTANELLTTFQRAWCMARPPCLFVAQPGELKAYDLNQSPPRHVEDWHPLDAVRRVADVAVQFHRYRRDQVESGKLFEDARFGTIDERADRRLIHDLKTVRKELLDTGLQPRHVHALIGRSIFIRYLEDRDILTPEYFEAVAEQNPEWQHCLQEEDEKPDFTQSHTNRRFHHVLRNKEFTYALFERLAEHFNGDMFPLDKDVVDRQGRELDEVQQELHLTPLRRFLLGDLNTQQSVLFFWAYDFSVIPIELISSIYEEFYHESQSDDKGTYYTPIALVDYALSQVLPESRLAENPKILDPACGSGVFLVESFRRIVRYKMRQLGRKLQPDELRLIIRDHLTGIEINEDAARVASFSLYLALLHYQEPPDILATPKLPHLLYVNGAQRDNDYYQCIINANTFSLMLEERKVFERKLDAIASCHRCEEAQDLYESLDALPLEPHSFDLIVGNPPWGFDRATSAETKAAQEQAEKWCIASDWSIGDREFAQAFIARTFTLLKPQGHCGLLVSTGVFFKDQNKSKLFRQRWLAECTLHAVINFAHVRRSFFNANSPFAFVHYQTYPASDDHRLLYWSAKRTIAAANKHVQAVILDHADMRRIQQTQVQVNDYLWKILWWGNHRDAALVNTIRFNPTLSHIATQRRWPKPGRGFQGPLYSQSTRDPNRESDWLSKYKELPIGKFQRYGHIIESNLTAVPPKVQFRGDKSIYEGWRLLVKRGISQANGKNGQIIARLENVPYCVRNSVHGWNMDGASNWERKVLTGILWSSLARYYFFLTASSWGLWHDEIQQEDVANLPIRFPDSPHLRNRIANIVSKLQESRELGELPPLFALLENGAGLEQRTKLEDQLDEAIFDLYKLDETERDLIRDMCQYGLEFFYRRVGNNSIEAIRDGRPLHGRITSLSANRKRETGLEGYLYAFLETWNHELVRQNGEFVWHVVQPTNNPMLAVQFEVINKDERTPRITSLGDEAWSDILKRCEAVLGVPVSQRVYIDGLIRVVTDTSIIIIRRNERRLWTRSSAREDAEATLLQAMYLQKAVVN